MGSRFNRNERVLRSYSIRLGLIPEHKHSNQKNSQRAHLGEDHESHDKEGSDQKTRLQFFLSESGARECPVMPPQTSNRFLSFSLPVFLPLRCSLKNKALIASHFHGSLQPDSACHPIGRKLGARAQSRYPNFYYRKYTSYKI